MTSFITVALFAILATGCVSNPYNEDIDPGSRSSMDKVLLEEEEVEIDHLEGIPRVNSNGYLPSEYKKAYNRLGAEEFRRRMAEERNLPKHTRLLQIFLFDRQLDAYIEGRRLDGSSSPQLESLDVWATGKPGCFRVPDELLVDGELDHLFWLCNPSKEEELQID